MNVLFLDIDGVINLQQLDGADWNVPPYSWTGIRPDKVAILNDIVAPGASDCGVVIISSWRFSKTAEAIQRELERHGFTGKIIDTTGTLYREKGWLTRGYEIMQWILNHWSHIEGFCMIDDGCHHSGIPLIQKHLLQTHSHRGLLPQHVDEVRRIWQKPWKP
jgi:hypothetical protein